jgi:trimeric autotransporter adhesin
MPFDPFGPPGPGGLGISLVTDGTTVITGARQLEFTSGATVTDGGNGFVQVALSGSGSGNVVGPASATTNNIPVFSSITGKAIGDSGVGISSLVSTGTPNNFTAEQTFSSGAAITGGTINGAAIGGTTTASGAFTALSATGTTTTAGITDSGGITTTTLGATGAINTTSTNGYQINGKTMLWSLGNVSGLYVGDSAGSSVTSQTNENTFVGNLSGQLVTSGQFNTAVGQHSMGFELTGGTNCAFGNDCMRNSVGVNGGVAMGKFAAACYFGQFSTTAGFNSMVGNAASILITGTTTLGDTITLTFTGGGLAGGVQTASYTITSNGETIPNVYAGLSAAVSANSAFIAANIALRTPPTNVNAMAVTYNGTSAVGVPLVVTAAVSGAATEVVTITNGVLATATDNVAMGAFALCGYGITSASFNIGIGDYTFANATTLLNSVAAGYQAGLNATTAQGLTLVGYNAGLAVTTATGVTCFGFQSGFSVTGSNSIAAFGSSAGRNTTGNNCAYFGNGAGQNTTTGNNNCAFGINALLGTAASTAATCCAFGQGSQQVVTGAAGNCTYGHLTGNALTNGSNNSLFGFSCGSSGLTTGAGNLWLVSGTTAYAPGNLSNTLFIGQANSTWGVLRATSINTTTVGALALFLDWLPATTTYANDAAAAAGTPAVAVGQLYRNGSVVQCRIS